MPATDLWPDFKIESKPRGIRQILEEAGQGLKEKTNGLVQFRVWPAESQRSEFPFRLRCQLRVEKLDYDYLLMEVDTSATGFPVEVRTDALGQNGLLLKIGDEASLLALLSNIFRSAQTTAVVQNLISMATE